MGIFGKKGTLYKILDEYAMLIKRYESGCVPYDELEAENKELQSTIALLNEKNQSESGQNAVYQERIGTLQDKCEKLQSTIALLNEKNQSESKQNAVYQKQIRDLQSKNAELTTERDTAKSSLENMKTEKEQLEAEVAALNSKRSCNSDSTLIDMNLLSTPLRNYTSLELMLARLQYFSTLHKCKSNAKLSDAVNQKIKNCKKGLINENSVSQILDGIRNIRVLKDVSFTLDGYSRQIDFIVITSEMIYILDSKSSFKDGDELTEKNHYSLEKQQENLITILEQSNLGMNFDSRVCHMLVYDKTLSPERVKSNYDSSVKDKRVHQKDIETAIKTLDEVAEENFERRYTDYGIFEIENAISRFCLNNPPVRRCPLCGKGKLQLCGFDNGNGCWIGCSNYAVDGCRYTENLNIEKELLPYLQKENS